MPEKKKAKISNNPMVAVKTEMEELDISDDNTKPPPVEEGVKEEDEFVASRISIKRPSSNNKRSYSRPSITRRRCGKGSGKGGGSGGCIKDDKTSSLAGTSTVGTSTGGEAEGQETATLGKTPRSSLV